MNKKILLVLAAFLLILTAASATVNTRFAWDTNYTNASTLLIPFYIQDTNAVGINDMNISICYGRTSSGIFSCSAGGTVIIRDKNAFSSTFVCQFDRNYTLGFRTTNRCTYAWTVTGLVTDINYTFDINAVDWNHTENVGMLANMNADSNSIMYDTRVPVTTSDQNTGWQTGYANIHLTCADGNGLCTTHYNLNSAGWLTYDTNIFVTASGANTLQYYSTDAAGNTETTKTVTIPIGTEPSATLDLNGLFTGINGMFNVFAGVITGVSTQAGSIGNLVAVSIIMMAVIGLIGGLFLVYRKSIGGWMQGLRP